MDSTDDDVESTPKVVAPRGVSGHRADGTLTASLRMLTARAMLREGRDPVTVAAATQVPLALVELMVDIDSAPPTPSSA